MCDGVMCAVCDGVMCAVCDGVMCAVRDGVVCAARHGVVCAICDGVLCAVRNGVPGHSPHLRPTDMRRELVCRDLPDVDHLLVAVLTYTPLRATSVMFYT